MRAMTVVRAFEDWDEDAVVALSLRAWAPVFESLHQVLGEVYEQMHPDWRVDQERSVRAACHTDGMRVWVAEAGSTVAGFVAARLDRDENLGEIYMIAVDPDHQRHGIASTLMDHSLQWIKDSGITLAMVETGGDPGHAPARRAYEQAGFVLLPVARYFKKL